MFIAIITFIIVLGLLIFVHELGHFVAARKLGVTVEEFGFGYPPRIAGIKRKGTIYSINWIPIGGFVKLKGEDGELKKEADSFSAKKIWKRFVILFSGVAMNFILAAFLISLGFMIGLPSAIDQTTVGNVRETKIQVISVLVNSPAQKAGLKTGDIIQNIDNNKFDNVTEILEYNAQKGPEPINLVILRGNEEKTLELTLTILDEEGTAKMGAGLVKTGIISYSWYQSITEGFKVTGYLTWQILSAFGDLIKNLIFTRTVSVDLAGPIGIAVISGQVAKLGFIYILQFTAILSINLAIINFIPFPALDGGRILFLIIEKIRRKPVTQKIEAMVHNVGFMLLILLMFLVTLRDFSRYRESFINLFDKIIGS